MAPQRRTERKELDPCMRARICELHTSVRWGYKRIHKVHPDIPISTIRYTIKKEQERINQRSKPRSGQPSKLSSEEKENLVHLARENPHIKLVELQQSVDMRCCKNTIRTVFRKLHMRKWLQRKRPEILAHNAEKRLEWAQRYAHYTAEDWRRVIWSDESTVERGKGGQLIWTWNSPKEQLIEHDVHEIRTGKSIKKMFWAAFRYNQRTQLIPLTPDGSSLGGGITATVIKQTYMDQLPGLLRDGNIFMHDNAPVHTAYIVRDLLQEMDIEVMTWPPYSPDLNPIENLWAIMKTIIWEDHPELLNAPDNDETLCILVQAAIDAWDSIEERVLRSLSDTMPHRVQAVLAADGWYTKY
jgi:transposase